jgi:hypothetical protein
MSGQYYPYALGDKRATMAGTMGSQVARRSKSHQSRSQFGLQAETRLHEVGIASNRRSECCGEYVPGSCTHRPSNHESHQHPKSSSCWPKVGGMIGVKS